jgi:uncharacterized protein (DUF1697 family)
MVFSSDADEADIKARLEASAGLCRKARRRADHEIAGVLARNPFSDKPGNRTVALFVDGPLPADALNDARGVQDELMRLGQREIYVFYGDGMAHSRLRIPAGDAGTARNMNTVAKLAEMAGAL